MAEKLGVQPTILNLYHGTRETQPSLIYNSEEGFDMRYSQIGLWGKAVYFAEYSSYSNAYSYKTGKIVGVK